MEDVFIGSEALLNGALTRGQLRWNYRAIFPDVYVAKSASPSLQTCTVGAWLWSGRRAIIAGSAAAALHGSRWVDGNAQVELMWRCGRPPRGIVVRNQRIEPDEIVRIAGLPVTSPERTALDLARHAPSGDSVVIALDALACATDLTAASVWPLADRYRGGRGLHQSIAPLSQMDGGSQSPKETLVRLALINAGLPAPRTHFTVTEGDTSALVAMGYEAPMVGVDFGTGAGEFLMRAGWKIVTVAEMDNSRVVALRVRAAIVSRGYPWWSLRRLPRN